MCSKCDVSLQKIYHKVWPSVTFPKFVLFPGCMCAFATTTGNGCSFIFWLGAGVWIMIRRWRLWWDRNCQLSWLSNSQEYDLRANLGYFSKVLRLFIWILCSWELVATCTVLILVFAYIGIYVYKRYFENLNPFLFLDLAISIIPESLASKMVYLIKNIFLANLFESHSKSIGIQVTGQQSVSS